MTFHDAFYDTVDDPLGHVRNDDLSKLPQSNGRRELTTVLWLRVST